MSRTGRPRAEVRTASRIMRFIFSLQDMRGITDKTFAKMVGCSDRSFIGWRQGKRAPNLMDVEAMLDVLSVKISFANAGGNKSLLEQEIEKWERRKKENA